MLVRLIKLLIIYDQKNFPNIPIDLDITKVNLKKIPEYEILCAGFPCQPFSKAGTQTGFDHKIAGQMFEEIMKFIQFHKPNYMILENVPNLIKHNKGITWDYMLSRLEAQDYLVEYDIISPLTSTFHKLERGLYIMYKKHDVGIKWPIKPIHKKIFKKYIY